MAFVFYDLETSGLHRDFDQILQFAAVRTDDDLQPVEEIDLRCRRLPHVVPSPSALMILHGAPEALDRAPLTHAALMARIARLLDQWGPAVVLGYNSIDFDERFLRQGFYQTLHPVYATQLGGNRRADVMRMVQAAAALRPDAIAVPSDGERQTFRLGDVARANAIALAEAEAHDALADIRATVAVAQLLRSKVPDLWERMIANADRAAVDRLLAETPVLLHTHGRGAGRRVTFAGRNPDDRNEVALLDLSVDPAPLLDLPAEALADQIGASPRPLRSIRINAQPLLLPPPPAGDLFAMATERERARRVRDLRGFAERIGAALRLRHAPDPDTQPSPWVESRIHDGFPDREDEQRRARFHRLGGAERLALARSFGDARLRALALRQIFLDRPGLLSSEEMAECAAWRRDRLLAEDDVPWTTVGKARAEIAKLALTCPPEKRDRLAAIARYIETLAGSAEEAANHQDGATDHDRALDQRGVDAGGEAAHQPARDEGAGEQR